MARHVIHTAAAPASPFYSQGIRAGDQLHVSGMVGIDPVTGKLAGPTDFADFNEEWARAFPEDPPARYVARLGVELPGVLVSIRMSAFVGEGPAGPVRA